ncbi:MAG: hypothetical protein HYZ18_13935 [Pseudogulbenkiania sp.]|nr:hypothetical protein [Pseudogulbenkiania sp.]
MKSPDTKDIRQHPAFRAIVDIAALLTEISDARKALAELETKARTAIPQHLNAYFTAAGDAAEGRIDLGDGRELIIEEEWWDHRNPLSSVRLAPRPQSLNTIALEAIALELAKAQQTETAT